MPLLNYSTGIKAAKTIGEIMDTLVQAGARQVMINYNDNHPPLAEALTFAVPIEGNRLEFRLDCHWRPIQQILKDDKRVTTKRFLTAEHAHMVGWRIIKVWVEAQLAFIEAEQASLPQLFLPHAVGPDGRTLYETVLNQYSLPSGNDAES